MRWSRVLLRARILKLNWLQSKSNGGEGKPYHVFRYQNSRGGEAFLSIGRVSCLLQGKRHRMMMVQVSSSGNGRYSGMKGIRL